MLIYKTTFIHRPKTGGNSTHVFFEKYSDFNVQKGKLNLNKGSIHFRYNKHQDCKQRIDFMRGNKKLGDPMGYTFLITLRNPFDLVLSWYYFKHKNKWNPKNWDKYIKNPNKQKGFLSKEWVDYNYNDLLNNPCGVKLRIFRFENLANDAKKFADELGLECGNFPRWNVSKEKKANGSYHQYYTDDQKDIMYNLFDDVLTKFNYSF